MHDDRSDPGIPHAGATEGGRAVIRGRLTIFAGAAPGVGKTWAMLSAAREEAARRSVLVGVVEFHGRSEAESLLAGLEVLPPRPGSFRDAGLRELDLDAALARRPSLLVVDTLAHGNAPGGRHPKRWQDVRELLDAGIDVFTALDVQELEGLGDVVFRIAGAVPDETVPDALFDSADEVRVVDLAPERLLERWREGKVRFRGSPERGAALFREGSLIALRALFLRRMAERVDAQMQDYRRGQGVEQAWAASDRILVCVSPSPYSDQLVRAASRMARSLHVPWFAVHVETPQSARRTDADRVRLAAHLRLAERLGAETGVVHGERTSDALLGFARERGVTKIIVGKPRNVRLRDRFRGSFIEEIIRGSGDIDVYATSGDSGEEPSRVSGAARRREGAWPYLASAGIAAFVSGLNWVVFGHENATDVGMVFLLGVVVAALRLGFGPSLFAALLSAASFVFFFTPPYFTFVMSEFTHVVTFIVMCLVAIVISDLGRRVRDQAEAARERERRTGVLYSVSRELARTAGVEALVQVAAGQIREVFSAHVVVYGPGAGDDLALLYRTTPGREPGPAEAAIVRWVFANTRDAGLGTDTLPGSHWLFVPLVGPGGGQGVLGLQPADPRLVESPDQRRVLDALATQVATALERARLADENERRRVESERERLRNVLLSSVSHDLRTPLAAIKGSASALRRAPYRIADPEAMELISAIEDEADRLARRVRDLLDMMRLESGEVRLDREWQPLEEAVGAALNRLEAALGGREVVTRLPADLPLVRIDGQAIEQVLLNLIENALKYSGPGSPIEIAATVQGGDIVVEVADRGPGIPPGQEERLFEKFFRVDDRGRAGGVGLGLAVCRAFVELHGGHIVAANRPDGGATFRFSLPGGRAPGDLSKVALGEEGEGSVEGGFGQ